MMARYPELATSANRLSNAAPNEYADVLRELYKIANSLRFSLVRSEQGDVFKVQGRCQQVDDLLAAFDPKQPTAQ